MLFPRLLVAVAALAITAAACGGSGAGSPPSVLAPTDPDQMRVLLATSERPVVLNVWGSWCIPCRSEAPLLRAAAREFDDRVRFVSVAVRDSERAAAEFIDEFRLGAFEHFFDPPGAVPAALGGRGVPLTFFFRPGGDLDTLHTGVIDERSLALRIDELLRGG